MKPVVQVKSLPLISKAWTTLITLGAFLAGCTPNAPTDDPAFSYRSFVDSTVSVYGPYVAVKLPLTKGVKPANPIQLAQGPEGVLYAANQTGEIYSLRDTDQDSLEDTGVLYCNVKDYGLRSPTGFTYRGDTIFVGTAQQIRVFVDKDKDGRADSSWMFFDAIPSS